MRKWCHKGILLRITKDRKLWGTMIAHILKINGTDIFYLQSISHVKNTTQLDAREVTAFCLNVIKTLNARGQCYFF